MRKVATFEKREDATAIFFHLKQLEIDAQLDDGEDGVELWVASEDHIPVAKKIIDEYEEKGAEALVAPDSPESEQKDFDSEEQQPFELPKTEEGSEQSQESYFDPVSDSSYEAKEEEKMAQPPAKVIFFGPWTRLLLVVCSICFFLSTYQTAKLYQEKKAELNLPLLAPINRVMIYDYPAVMSKISKLADLVVQGQSQAEGESGVTEEQQKLTKEIEKEPLWVGYYNIMLNYDKREILFKAPMFTSIFHGQVWRIITPIFLHAGILHFLFNMLWLWFLGKMVEGNMSSISYLSFILLTGAVSNTFQYLMTGPFFMGISGVLCAMAGYIWSRKKIAPWEIYPIDRGTLLFLGFFIFGLLGLQLVTFYLQMVHNYTFPLNFANTAHISGVLMGLILGRTKLFQKSRT